MKIAPARLVRGAVALVALVSIMTGCLSAQQTDALNALNRDRAAHGLKALKTHGDLQAKAQAWADRLARDNRLYHSTLTAGAPSCWRGLGENVGYGASVGQVQQAYMNSAAHKANILNRTYDWVGVGVAKNGSRVYTVQVFMDGC